jgi:undecaprenyl-diphosphatase
MALDILESTKITKKLSTKQAIIIALICFAFGIVIFILAYVGMRQNSGLGVYNQTILSWVVNHRNPSITNIVKVVTAVADPIPFIIITMLIVGIWAIYKHEIWRPLLLAVSMGVAAATSTLLKTVTMDLRPPKIDMIPAFKLDYSFPSGHTISMIVFLLVIGYLLYSRNYSIGRVCFWTITAMLGTMAIAASRLYLGYHWLTDVIASIGLGFIILAIIILIDRFAISKFDKLK